MMHLKLFTSLLSRFARARLLKNFPRTVSRRNSFVVLSPPVQCNVKSYKLSININKISIKIWNDILQIFLYPGMGSELILQNFFIIKFSPFYIRFMFFESKILDLSRMDFQSKEQNFNHFQFIFLSLKSIGTIFSRKKGQRGEMGVRIHWGFS